jgi:molybdate transport system substrate-binding protein
MSSAIAPRKRKRALLLAAAGVVLFSTALKAAEIKLIASAGVKSACLELLLQFEKEAGHTVAASWSSSRPIRNRIEAGEAADLVIIGDPELQELLKLGKLDADSHADFAKSGIAVAVRVGAPKPDIRSAAALKTSLLAAKSVAYSLGLSGAYIDNMLQTLRIEDQLKPKRVPVRPSEPVGEVVARGDAEIGFHQLSELLPVSGIEIVGPLPAELQHFTIFSGAVHHAAKEPEAAGKLLKFLTAPAATPILARHGLEPAG